MAKLTNKDVLKLAQLARLTLTDDELKAFTTEINQVLGYVEQLQTVDVSDTEPTSQVTGLENVTREDVIVHDVISRKELLKNVPETTPDGYIKVKRIIQ